MSEIAYRPRRPPPPVDFSLPLILCLAAFVIFQIWQTRSILAARAQVAAAIATQQRAVAATQLEHTRLDALARQLVVLAGRGNPRAQAIIGMLRREGVSLPKPR